MSPPQARRIGPSAVGPNPDTLARATGFQRIAGVDEAGRGPWAGPVVACAVSLRRRPLPVRIDDSKRLTSAQRDNAFDVILSSADVGIGIISADEIDACNILEATLRAMAQAIRDLPRAPDLVLIDGTSAPRMEIPCWPIVRGDQRSYAISCASIVAKVVRDRLMAFYHTLDPRYQFNRHKGYGTSLHARVLSALGPSALHRLTFQPVAASIPAAVPAASDALAPAR